MTFPPRLIMIGAQKAGTTTLADALARHPSIMLGAEKEPDYYTRFYDRGLDWYQTNYPNGQAEWLLDASTAYSSGFIDKRTNTPFPVAQRIKETVDDPRILYILRDPVDRAYSSYWHAKRYGNERRSVRDAIIENSIYAKQGYYSEHLGYFLQHFPRKHILVLDFDDLRRNQQSVVKGVLDFLNLPPMDEHGLNCERPKNKGFQYSSLAQATMRLFPSEGHFKETLSKGKKLAPAFLKPLAKSLLTRDIPPINAKDAARLSHMFEPYTRRLEDMLNRSFAHWRRPEDTATQKLGVPNLTIYPSSTQDILAP